MTALWPQHLLAEPCPSVFERISQLTRSTFSSTTEAVNDSVDDAVDDSVAIIWFPKTNDTFTTTNLEHDGKLFGTQNGFRIKGSISALKRLDEIKHTGHFRFGINTTAEERKKLDAILASSALTNISCVAGACRALREAGIMRTPIIIRNVPILNTVYLATLRLLPGSKITRVEYVGENKLKTILSSKDLWSELGLLTGLTAETAMILYLTIGTADGKETNFVVPVTTDGALGEPKTNR